MHLDFETFARYTGGEREKWRSWFSAHPEALDVPVQPEGRFATVGALIDHIFIVERRHVQRLRGETLHEKTGLSGRHAPPLFDYGASVRRELQQFVSELDEDAAERPFAVTVQSGGEFIITPRKLIFHCLLHETRHWAQIALALRLAGFTPPGDHDLFYSKAMR